MTIRNILLMVLLFTSLLASNTVTADLSPPVVNSVYFSASSATGGDAVTLYVNATDPDGLDYGYAYLYVAYNASWYYLDVVYLYPSASDPNLMMGDFIVSPYWRNGVLYVGDMSLTDGSGNYKWYSNGTDFVSSTVTIYGTTPDLNPPVLNSIYIDKTRATSNEVINVYANITDDLSGVNYVSVDIGYLNATATVPYYIYKTTVYLFNTSTSSLYQGSFSINQYWPSGNYSISYVSLSDNANNWRGYDIYSANITLPTFEVWGTIADNSPPVLNEITFPSTTAPQGSYYSYYINATDDYAGVDYGYAIFNYYVNGSWTFLSYSYFYYDSPNDLYLGTVFIPELPFGTLIGIESITIFDFANNYADYYNGSDFISPIVTVSQPLSDLVSITIDGPSTVDAGQTASYNVTIKNNSSIGISGWLSVAAENLLFSYGFYYDLVDVPAYSEVTISASGIIYDQGNYTVNAYYDIQGTVTAIVASANLTVLPPKSIGEIFVTVTPSFGKSAVNETVNFVAKIESTFDHDMLNVYFEVGITDPFGYTVYPVMQYIDLYANSYAEVYFDYTFEQEGTYWITATLFDDINVQWIFEFSWDVYSVTTSTSTSDSDTISDTSDTTSTTSTPTTETTNSTGNNTVSVLPEIALPGFDFGLTLLSLTSFMIASVVIRRRKLR